MTSLILSKTQPSQDLAKPFFFVFTNHRKKMVILASGLMSNLPSSSISLWTAKYIYKKHKYMNKINNRKYLFDFVHN